MDRRAERQPLEHGLILNRPKRQPQAIPENGGTWDYIDRDWTNHERRSAVARAVTERGREYILPIKVADEIELPGVPPTIGYVSLNQYSIEQIADMLIKTLRS